jgi:hypothetical protein
VPKNLLLDKSRLTVIRKLFEKLNLMNYCLEREIVLINPPFFPEYLTLYGKTQKRQHNTEWDRLIIVIQLFDLKKQMRCMMYGMQIILNS